MIPRAKLTNQIFGNPLKVRVSACRKRIRDHRGTNRTQAQAANPNEDDSQPMAQFPADSAAVRQLVNVDLSPAFGDAQAANIAESVVEQEVGIT
jgi:hypothetical protein